MFNVGDAVVNLVLGPTAAFEGQVKKATESAADAAGQSAGQRLQASLSKVLTPTKVGAGLGVLFTTATDAAANFEDQLRTINTVAHLSDSELAGVGDSIKALSSETGRSLEDLTGGFYDLVSAGVPADKAMKTLSDSAKLAVGNLGSTGEAVDIVTTALNAFKIDAKDSAHVTDVFAQAVADGKTTVAGLSQGISRIAPIAASAGVSLEEVAAGTAVMTLNGASAAQAYTDMAATLSALLTPNAELNDLQKQTGINFAELAKSKGLAVSLDELRKATNGDNEAFAKALGSTEALTYAFSVTGDNAGTFAAELDKMKHSSDNGGIAMSQFSEKMKSPIEQGRKLVATIQSFLVTTGAPFVNSLGPAIFALNQLGQAFGVGSIASKLFGGAIGGLIGRVTGNLGKPLAKAIQGSLGVAFSTAGESASLGFQKLLTLAVTKVQIPAQMLMTRLETTFLDAFSMLGNSSAVLFAKNFLANSALGKLAALAASAVGVVTIAAAVVFVGGQIAQGVQDANEKALRDSIQNALDDGSAAGIADVQKNIEGLLRGARASHNSSWEQIILGAQGDFQKALQDRSRILEQQENHDAANARKAGQQTGDAYANAMAEATAAGITANQSRAQDAVERANAKLAKATGQVIPSIFTAAGRRMMDSVAQGINDQRQKPVDAFNTLLDMMKNALTPAQERARLIGELTSKALADGLRSKDPAVRAQAQATKQAIIDRLNALGVTAHSIGAKGMAELKKGMNSKDPDIRAAALAAYNAAAGKGPALGPSDLPAAGTAWGSGLVHNLASGMLLAQAGVVARSRAIATAIANELRPGSPTKSGPLSEGGGMEGWGKKLGHHFAVGIASAAGAVDAAGAMLGAAARPGGLGALTPALAASGAVSGAAGAVYGGSSSSASFGDIHIHLHDIGNDVSSERAARFGEQVAKSMAQNFRVDGARIGVPPRTA